MTGDLASALRPSLVMTGLFAALLGVAYPALITGIAQTLFPHQANGSLISDHGAITGSTLIGQNFARADYFHPRPSAAGKGYDATASGGSNLGPSSKALTDRIKTDRAAIKGEIPADMLTTSASGLDPDISPDSARLQITRVAGARHLEPAALDLLIARNTDGPVLGFSGEPRVNVLALNRALDTLAPSGAQAAR
jgi:K+-transporting ATPase ATPase C chain